MKFKISKAKLLFKASYFNAIIVVARAFSGIVLSKVIAFLLGPSGLALMGNLRSFIQAVSSFTASGYQNGTVRYVSEFIENKKEKDKVIATIFQLSLGFSLIIGIVLWLFASTWSIYLFKTESYTNVIKTLGIGLPFFSFNLLIIYVLNGVQNYKKLVIVNTILSLVNMLITTAFAIYFGIKGALIGVILGPILVFIINLFALGKERTLFLTVFRPELFSIKILKNMNAYLLMSVYSALIVSITFLLIRNLIIEKLSILEAGYWEAMNRISSFYLMFFLSLTSFYLLPQLSKTNDFKVFRREIKGFYLLSVPLLIFSFTLIYFLRYYLLRLLLSEEFLPTSSLFFWQLIGDFISVLAIALVKQFHAKLMVKAYLVCNGLLNILYFSLSYLLIDKFGLQGIVKAYALSYFIYFVVVILFLWYYFKVKKLEN